MPQVLGNNGTARHCKLVCVFFAPCTLQLASSYEVKTKKLECFRILCICISPTGRNSSICAKTPASVLLLASCPVIFLICPSSLLMSPFSASIEFLRDRHKVSNAYITESGASILYILYCIENISFQLIWYLIWISHEMTAFFNFVFSK